MDRGRTIQLLLTTRFLQGFTRNTYPEKLSAVVPSAVHSFNSLDIKELKTVLMSKDTNTGDH